jgi:hypothetical protein
MCSPYEFNIAWILKFALDELAHFWVLFPSVERRACHKPQLEVRTTRFSEHLRACFVIKNVVDEL